MQVLSSRQSSSLGPLGSEASGALGSDPVEGSLTGPEGSVEGFDGSEGSDGSDGSEGSDGSDDSDGSEFFDGIVLAAALLITSICGALYAAKMPNPSLRNAARRLNRSFAMAIAL